MKHSDRKAYKQRKRRTVSIAADSLGSYDEHEELLAAANAVINSAHVRSSTFWSRMEPFFRFISDGDIAYLKLQGKLESAAPTPTLFISNTEGITSIHNGYGLTEQENEVGLATETGRLELLPDQLEPGASDHIGIPLYQRFMSALIVEEDYSNRNEVQNADAYKTGFELDGELESNGLDHLLVIQSAAPTAYRVSGKQDTGNDPEIDMLETMDVGIDTNFDQSLNSVLTDHSLIPDMAFSVSQYGSMEINEKLLLEAKSIGIFPNLVSGIGEMDDEGINDSIRQLEARYQEQVSKKQGLLGKLLKSASDTKELQEKELEQRALDKLVAIAYEKYMTFQSLKATGSKRSGKKTAKQASGIKRRSSGNQMAEQAAFINLDVAELGAFIKQEEAKLAAFIKWTLHRCHEFEGTGKSCFSEQLFRNMFISYLNGGASVNTSTHGESAKTYANRSGRSLEARVSASLGSQPSPQTSQFSQNGCSSNMLPPKPYANRSGRSLEARVSASLGSQPSPQTSQFSQNGCSSDMLPPKPYANRSGRSLEASVSASLGSQPSPQTSQFSQNGCSSDMLPPKPYANRSGRSLEASVSASLGSQPSPQTSQFSQNGCSSDMLPPKPYANRSGRSLEASVSASLGSQPSPQTSQFSQNGCSSDMLPPKPYANRSGRSLEASVSASLGSQPSPQTSQFSQNGCSSNMLPPKPYANRSGRSLEARVSASLGSQPIPQTSQFSQNGCSSDMLPPKPYANRSGRSLEARVSASLGSQPSPQTSQFSQNGCSSDMLPPKPYANRSGRSLEASVSASLGSQPSPQTSQFNQNGCSSDMLPPKPYANRSGRSLEASVSASLGSQPSPQTS